jgi:SRSO17 transposase
LVDFRLFLPEAWASEPARCDRVKVPIEERVHRTKCELALEMVKAARERQLGHQWVGGDAIYGNNQELCSALEELGEVFLMDVSSNLVVWAEDPQPQPQEPPIRGRPRTRAKAGNEASQRQSVADLVARHFQAESRMLSLRETTKGPLRAEILVREVWLWNRRTEQRARPRLLIARRDADGSYKYSLSNAPTDTPWERLGYMQAQRFFIERAFEDAKSELGMAQYEVRGWRGWHHHIALCCLALLFTLKERITFAEQVPLLSVRDIVELLAFYLPRRTRDPDAVLANLQARHAARASAINSASKRSRTVTK